MQVSQHRKESKYQTSLVDKAKKRVRETIKEQTGMIIDMPDSELPPLAIQQEGVSLMQRPDRY